MVKHELSGVATMKLSRKLLRPTSVNALALFLAFTPVTLLADPGPAHQVDQVFPISLGTSGGNINDISKGFCYGGTLGALVAKGSTQYILSNNHVLARINAAAIGEDIIQPGLIDQSPGCFKDTTDVVADLSDFDMIRFKSKGSTPINLVDAAIAQVRAGAVKTTGDILDIGTLSSDTLAPTLGLAVQKSGRTTGWTQGSINAIDATVNVSYGSGKTAQFIHQVIVTPGSFIAGGDSGSLMVENVATNPRAVGLLFAGSSSIAIANPIDAVLGKFGVAMVGTAPSASWSGKIFEWAKNLFGVKPSYAANAPLPPQVDPAAVDAVKRVKERHEGKLLALPGVVGVAVGLSEREPGTPAIEVYVVKATASLRVAIPNVLDGVEVKTIETGEIFAR
jgi:hypothetical protein